MKQVLIVVPTHNSEEFISRTLESLVNQTYKNIDILVIDNNSSDFTLNKADGFDIDIIQNLQNFGRIGNWNKCLEMFAQSNSDYCKLVFAGDTLEPTCIEDQMKEMKKGIQVVSCAHKVKGGLTDYVMNHVPQDSFVKMRLTPKQSLHLSLKKGNWFAGTTACMLFSKEALSTRKFTAGLDWAADWKFWAEMAAYNDIVYLSKVLANFYLYSRKGYGNLVGTEQASEEEKTVRNYITDVLLDSI